MAILAYTKNWRTPENIRMVTGTLNHFGKIAKSGNWIGGVGRKMNDNRFKCTSCAWCAPFRAFHPEIIEVLMYRRPLTELAMLGIGNSVDVLAESAVNILHSLDDNGILRLRFDLPHNKKCSPRFLEYPTKYVDTRLEQYYKSRQTEPVGLLCDLTFWAVQFLTLVEKEEIAE